MNVEVRWLQRNAMLMAPQGLSPLAGLGSICSAQLACCISARGLSSFYAHHECGGQFLQYWVLGRRCHLKPAHSSAPVATCAALPILCPIAPSIETLLPSAADHGAQRVPGHRDWRPMPLLLLSSSSSCIHFPQITAPNEFQGTVIGDVNRRKGIIMGSEQEGDDVIINVSRSVFRGNRVEGCCLHHHGQ